MALSYWRWASRNKFDVYAISEESVFIERMPPWEQLVVTHAQLDNLPRSWREELSRWRGIYFILDSTDGKGYVGAAYGKDNTLSAMDVLPKVRARWKQKAKGTEV